MFQDTITVYNKYIDAGVEKWQRTVLGGVFWDSSKGAVIRKMGVATPDGLQAITQIVIPKDTVEVNRIYSKPEAWKALPDKSKAWTLQAGDIVILGAITQEVTSSTKELRTFDDVVLLVSADYKDYGAGMSHWEVTGK